jgi:hypothetical protein
MWWQWANGRSQRRRRELGRWRHVSHIETWRCLVGCPIPEWQCQQGGGELAEEGTGHALGIARCTPFTRSRGQRHRNKLRRRRHTMRGHAPSISECAPFTRSRGRRRRNEGRRRRYELGRWGQPRQRAIGHIATWRRNELGRRHHTTWGHALSSSRCGPFTCGRGRRR